MDVVVKISNVFVVIA
jgi:hypothetical protein